MRKKSAVSEAKARKRACPIGHYMAMLAVLNPPKVAVCLTRNAGTPDNRYMREIRELLCLAALLSLSSISVWAAVQVAQQDFPAASALEPVELRSWLTERDLSQMTPATQSRVARRFQDELRRGGNWGADPRSLDPQQRELLEENLTIVLGYWFRDKMNRYFDQRPERRTAWLDREIEELEQLIGGNRDRNRRRSPATIPGSLYVIGMIGSRMEKWIQQADPETQQRMREFQRAVQERLLRPRS
jgi:hypothetical protein